MNISALIAHVHDQIFDPTRLPVAATALVIVAVAGLITGPLSGNANPLLWRAVDLLFGALGSKLDKTERSVSDLAARGMVVTFMGVVIAFLVGTFFQTASTHYPNFKIVDIVALSLILTAGTVWQGLGRLYKALKAKGMIKGAFYTIAKTTRNNLAASDEYTITRVGIGMGAKAFDKGVVAPILWYLIAGLPAAYLYAVLGALSWRFGKEGFTKGFGSLSLALEKLMGFVPNVFAGTLLALAGILTPTAGMTRAVFGLMSLQKGRAKYAEGGAVVTAMAYALNVSLGGPTQDLDGSAIQRGWAGPSGATAQLEAKHLHRALYILVMAHLLLLAALLVGIVIGDPRFFAQNA